MATEKTPLLLAKNEAVVIDMKFAEKKKLKKLVDENK
jgi:hypothetical protein